MSYLTDAEKEEISQMEQLFSSPGWKVFIQRNMDALEVLPQAALMAETVEDLYMIKGQRSALEQIVHYERSYMKSIDDVEEERQVEAAMRKEALELSRAANV